MKNLHFVLFPALILFFGYSNAQLNQQNLTYGYSTQQKVFQKDYTVQYQKIKIYLIKAKPSLKQAVAGVGNYTNLETAMKAKMIVVKEINVDGQVNDLIFRNISKKTIMLQIGDVVQGGKQDRVVAEDILLKPGESRQVKVFCVEHGRWQGDNQNNVATFNTYHSNINNSVKKQIVLNNNQSEVWLEVDKLNTLNNTNTSTGTYTAVTKSGKYNQEIQTYITNIMKIINSDSNIVGVLAVTGDSIIGCEIYSTPALFKANVKNILNSFVSEAVLNGKAVTIKDAKVEKYLNSLLKSDEQQNRILQNNGKSLYQNGKKVKLSSF